jgi:glycosylphosphatidylinositol deacylase
MLTKTTGVFMSFSESMDVCLRTSLPFIFIALTFFAVSLSKASQGSWTRGWLSFLTGTSQKSVDFNVNDLMLGTQDPFLWFLVPLFGVISVGICIAGNYLITILMHVFAFIYGWARVLFGGQSDSRYVCSASHIFSHCDTIANRCFSRTTFATTGGRQRLITTAILLLLITTLIPYQFAYMVLTIVQLCTCVRALRLARDTHSGAHYNFYNYATSMLVLMLWVLPINMPVLIVWIHNLAVHWLTPFSTHHNLLAVLPLVLLVEVMSAGNMTPRVTGRYVITPSIQHSTELSTDCFQTEHAS